MVLLGRILITGANGFVGSYLAKSLEEQGYDALKISPSLSDNPKIKTLKVDLTNVADLKKLSSFTFDIVFHCASQQPRPNLTYADYHKGNVQILENVLNAITLSKQAKVVHFSSAAVYGNIRHQVLDENSAVNPQNDYALTKLFSEYLLQCRSQQRDFSAFCFRLPSIFGVGQIGGIAHTYFDALKKNQPLEIFSQGKLWRNIVAVESVVDAVLKVLKTNLQGYHLYLLGSQTSLTMAQIAEKMAKRLHSQSKILLVDQKVPVEFDWKFNLNKIENDLGFLPQSLEDALIHYVDQMKIQYDKN